MDTETLYSIFAYLNEPVDAGLIKLLQVCDIGCYDSFCNLSEINFTIECNNFYRRKISGDALSPGKLTVLNNIGKKVARMNESEFDLMVSNIPQAEMKYPLMQEMTEKLSGKPYSDMLKGISTIFRIRGGRQLHQIITGTLPLPSTASVDSYLNGFESITEGELQVN